jgi:hypothetical protein
VKHRLPIILSKETLLDLQKEVRSRKVPIQALILEIIEGYLEGSGKTGKSVGDTTERRFSAVQSKTE